MIIARGRSVCAALGPAVRMPWQTARIHCPGLGLERLARSPPDPHRVGVLPFSTPTLSVTPSTKRATGPPRTTAAGQTLPPDIDPRGTSSCIVRPCPEVRQRDSILSGRACSFMRAIVTAHRQARSNPSRRFVGGRCPVRAETGDRHDAPKRPGGRDSHRNHG